MIDEAKLHRKKILRTELAASSKVSAIANCFLVSLYLLALFSIRADLEYSLYFGLFLIFAQSIRYKHALNISLSDTDWLNRFTAIILINSINWFLVISTVLLKNAQNAQVTVLSMTITAGLIASGAYSLSVSKRDFYIYQFCMIGAALIGFNLNSTETLYRVSVTTICILFLAYLHLQRKNQEEAWLEKIMHNLELQKIIDTIPGGISVLRDGVYIRANEYLKKYVLRSHDGTHLLGSKLGDFNNDQNEFVDKLLAFSKSQENFIKFETQIEINNEKRYHLVVAQNIFKYKKVDTVVATIDIQDLKNIEIENQINLSKLEHNSKMASLGEMSSGLAHEINNPLAIISGRTQMLLKLVKTQSTDFASYEKNINALEKTTHRIAKIVKGLKTFARDAEKDNFSHARLKDIIEDTLSFCEARFKNYGIQFTCQLNQNENTLIDCRPTQISQVLLNTLNNSYDAILNLENKWIDLSVEKKDHLIIIKITDSGPGIDKAIQSKLMQPFFTTKEVGKGTGLGLSLSKGIIESHNGKIYFNFNHPTNTQLIIELEAVQIISQVS